MPALERSPRLARFKNFELDLRTGELRPSGGEAIRLGEQPFQILVALLESPGEVVLREELRKRLWPNDTIVEFEHSISAAMNRLRQALGDSADKPLFIETLARRGYRWMIPVEWVEAGHKKALGSSAASAEKHEIRKSLIGKKVSHYRILEVLGGGGMGVVYKAEDLKLGRCVALKFLGEELIGDHRALERFEREARSASALENPNICPIYEFGEHEGQPFLVMQLLQGQTLRQRIESAGRGRSAFTQGELLDFAVQIVTGLEAAHQKGILHRDIKPANIFITNRAEIKLLDFGLAKLMDNTTILNLAPTQHFEQTSPGPAFPVASLASMTLTGAMMGTASYMSPEQVRKEKLDARSDLFSFGVVLYEMATGHQPFRGDDLQAIHDAVLNTAPPSPLAFNPVLAPELAIIIGKALQKDRDKRYQSASEIASDLKRIHVAESVSAATTQAASAQPSPTTVLARRPTRAKLVSAVIAAGVVLAVATFVVRKLTPHSSSLQVENMEIERLTSSGEVDQVAISPDGRYLAYSQHEPGGGVGVRMKQLLTGSDVQILPANAKVVEMYGLTFSRDGQYIYFVPDENAAGFHSLYRMPALGGPTRLLIPDIIDSPVSFSPDGLQFVFTYALGGRNLLELRIANKDGTDNRVLAAIAGGSDDFQPGPAWSPDGAVIAVSVMLRGDQIRYALDLVSVADGSVRQLHSNSFGIGRPVWVSANFLVVPLRGRNGRGQLWSISFPGGQTKRLTNDLEDYRYFGIDFSREAQALAATVSTQVSNIWVAPAKDLSSARQITFGKLSLLDVAATAQGKLLARSGDGGLWMANSDTSQPSPFTDVRNALSLTSCGQFLLVESYVGDKVELVRVGADGSNPVELVSGDIGPPICSADGYVFYPNYVKPQSISRLAVHGGTPSEIARSPGFGILSRLSVSPDAKLLAFAYDEATPALGTKLAVMAATGGPVVKSYAVPGDVSGLGWSPDGRRLQYLLTRKGATNIWEQHLDGGRPTQLTNFTSGRIFDFNWSPDGEQLLLTRGAVSRDMVLLSHLH